MIKQVKKNNDTEVVFNDRLRECHLLNDFNKPRFNYN